MKKIAILIQVFIISITICNAQHTCPELSTVFKRYTISELGNNKILITFIPHDWLLDYNMTNVSGIIDFGNGQTSSDLYSVHLQEYDKTLYSDGVGGAEIYITSTITATVTEEEGPFICPNIFVSEMIISNVETNNSFITELYDFDNPDGDKVYYQNDDITFGVKITGFGYSQSDLFTYKIKIGDDDICTGSIYGSDFSSSGFNTKCTTTLPQYFGTSNFIFELYQYDVEVSSGTFLVHRNDKETTTDEKKYVDGIRMCSCSETFDPNIEVELTEYNGKVEIDYEVVNLSSLPYDYFYLTTDKTIYYKDGTRSKTIHEVTPGAQYIWDFDRYKKNSIMKPDYNIQRIEYIVTMDFLCYITTTRFDGDGYVTKNERELARYVLKINITPPKLESSYDFPNTGGTFNIGNVGGNCTAIEIFNKKDPLDDLSWLDSYISNGNIYVSTTKNKEDKELTIRVFANDEYGYLEGLSTDKGYREISITQDRFYDDNYVEGPFLSLTNNYSLDYFEDDYFSYGGAFYDDDRSGFYSKPYYINIPEVYRMNLGCNDRVGKCKLVFDHLKHHTGEYSESSILRYNECISKSGTGYYDFESWTDSDWYDKEKFVGQEHDIYMAHFVSEDKVLDSNFFELVSPGDEKVRIITANNKVVLSGKSGKLQLAKGGRFYAGIYPLCEPRYTIDDIIVSQEVSQSQKSATISDTVSRDTAHHDIVYHDIELTYNEVADKEKSSTLIKVYPNPSEGRFILDISGFDNVHGELNILSTDGKIVHTQSNISDPVIEIDISHVPQGVYVIYFASEGTLYTNNIFKY